MTKVDLAGPARPDVHTPTTLGIVSITFAIALIFWGICANLLFLAPPLLIEVVSQAAQNRAEHRRMVVDLAQKLSEEAARETDPEKKAALESRRQIAETEVNAMAESSTDASTAVIRDLPLRSPTYISHFLVDLVSGLILNVLMLVGGVGLIFRARWGRILSMVAAGAKIARLLALALSMSLIVAPFSARMISLMEERMPVEGAESVATRVQAVMTGSSWVLALVGSIYPSVLIAVLRRPGVRASFGGRVTS